MVLNGDLYSWENHRTMGGGATFSSSLYLGNPPKMEKLTLTRLTLGKTFIYVENQWFPVWKKIYKFWDLHIYCMLVCRSVTIKHCDFTTFHHIQWSMSLHIYIYDNHEADRTWDFQWYHHCTGLKKKTKTYDILSTPA